MARTVSGRRLTEEHRRAQRDLAVGTVAELRPVWNTLTRDRIGQDQGLLLAAALPIVEAAHLESQGLAAEYVEQFRAAEAPDAEPLTVTGEAPASSRRRRTTVVAPAAEGSSRRRRSTVIVPRDPVEFDERRAAGALIAAGPQTVLTASPAPEQQVMDRGFVEMAGAGVRVVLDGGRDQIRQAVELDRVALGYARVTRPDACSWCAMLASLGAWYKGEKAFTTADAKYTGDGRFKVHNSCQCTLEPIYDRRADLPPETAKFRAMWKTATKDAESGDELKAFRRAYEAENGSWRQNRKRGGQEPETAGGTDTPPPTEPPATGAPAAADEPRRGKVDRSQVKHVLQHELDTAGRLAELGHDVTFREPVDPTKTSDAFVGGVRAEFKSPESASRNTIMKAVSKKRYKQGPRFVLDLSRSAMSLDNGEQLARDLVRQYRDDGISTIMVIEKAGDGRPQQRIVGEEVPEWLE